MFGKSNLYLFSDTMNVRMPKQNKSVIIGKLNLSMIKIIFYQHKQVWWLSDGQFPSERQSHCPIFGKGYPSDTFFHGGLCKCRLFSIIYTFAAGYTK